MTLSIVIITFNEEANLARTLESVEPLMRELDGEVVIVDSGSTDRTAEIARRFDAKFFIEPWKGFAAQKNSAIEKAGGDWVLSLDADEEVGPELAMEIARVITAAGDSPATVAFSVPRKNLFLGRWIRHGGYWPDRKVRLFRRGAAQFAGRLVHEDLSLAPGQQVRTLNHPLVHHAYPALYSYIDHMNRYSSLGAQMAGPRAFNPINIFVRPRLTFFYNYIFRLGFLDGREGLLLHLYHSTYVSWKYAKAWESSRKSHEPS